jgi:FkbM family methyltransferase
MAFEPSPTAFDLMQKNIALSKCDNIHTYQRAVASSKTELFLDESDRGNSGAAHVSDKGAPIFAQPITVSDIRTVGEHQDVFVKIDTEGYEMEVLKGIQELLSANLVRKLVIEIDEVNLTKFGSSSAGVYEYLSSHGFTPELGLRPGHYDEVFVAKR